MVLACALAAVVAYRHGHSVGAAKVTAQWEAERAVLNQKIAEETQRAIETERKLRAQLDANRRSYEREKARIAANYNAAIDSLRDRPTARAGDAGVPEGATAGVGSTGAELSRDDAAFLVWYASEAARVQAALEACVAAYKRVEEVVNGGD
jgi:hypothetical protein